MDINDLRAITTIFSFAVFIGILVWAFSKHKAQDFEDAAKIPLDREEDPTTSPRK
ncbi:MAG: CcoQ/FixQ family Cbb3-type cytochrome c oxidase assembly chaperone [Burkholderiales bacterium]|jgi:cytochrome c oxidase cbb3-type subunit 4|nr:CcoQ/FixQ family Cbb3-type cytochrome c oxidase assembly chaperone [Burkholderiales bacterium]